jgi:hypothetical protein
MRAMRRARATRIVSRVVPESLSTHEAAPAIDHGRRAGSRLRPELLEILEALLLGIVAIATAWSGYQATRWNARQAHLYGISSKERLIGSQAATRSGQEQLYDASVFSFWLQAKASGNREAVQLFERRFRPEFRPAFNAWLATQPFTNPKAPPGPQVMPQYHNGQAAKQRVYEARATRDFELGTTAREHGDKYVRNTLLLATVLFLTALAQRFTVRGVRLSLLGLSAILLVLALYFVGTYPRA